MKRANLRRAVSVAALIALCAGGAMAAPLGTEFTYQGEVVDGTVVAAGPVDLRFRLYDSLVGGLRVDSVGGNGLVQLGTALVNGRFTTTLDFGAAVYAGDARYLEIDIRPAGGGAYTTLAPRQLLSATPYARFAPNAQNAVNATNAINATNATNATNAVNATNATTATTANNALNLGSNPPSFYTNASNMSAGTLGDARLSANVALLNAVQTFTAAKTFAAAAAFTAAGAPFTVSSTTLVTNLNADLLDGQHGAFYQNAANLNAGTVGDARLSTNVALLDRNPQTFTGANSFNNTVAVNGFLGVNTSGGIGSAQMVVSGTATAGTYAGLHVNGTDPQSWPFVGYSTAGAFRAWTFFNGQDNTWNLVNVTGGNFSPQLTVTNAGQMGIGTTAPEAPLHVLSSSAGAVGSFPGAGLVVENGGFDNEIQFQSDAAGFAGLSFGRPGSNFPGGVYYRHSDDTLLLRTGSNTDRLTVSNSGTTIASGDVTVATDASSFIFKDSTAASPAPEIFMFASGTGNSDRMIVAHSPSFPTWGIQYQDSTDTFRFLAGGVNRLSIALGGGTVTIPGLLSKGGGTFKIDHPLDPENKYLYHSFVESPDMKNIYDGTITTDDQGFATVELPAYFDALNKDFRYQLTVIDESAPDTTFARVARKIDHNSFVIRTVPGNLEVSWQVTGTRKDAFANQNRIVPEVAKAPEDKGKYIHPTAFGKPESLGIGYVPNTPRPAPVPDKAHSDGTNPSSPSGSN